MFNSYFHALHQMRTMAVVKMNIQDLILVIQTGIIAFTSKHVDIVIVRKGKTASHLMEEHIAQ